MGINGKNEGTACANTSGCYLQTALVRRARKLCVDKIRRRAGQRVQELVPDLLSKLVPDWGTPIFAGVRQSPLPDFLTFGMAGDLVRLILNPQIVLNLNKFSSKNINQSIRLEAP